MAVGSTGGAPSLPDLVIPGLLVGIPLVVILAILAIQVATGASWVPIARRWLDTRHATQPVEPVD